MQLAFRVGMKLFQPTEYSLDPGRIGWKSRPRGLSGRLGNGCALFRSGGHAKPMHITIAGYNAAVGELEDLDKDLSILKDEADNIDPYKYQRRRRIIYAVLTGAGLAGMSFLVLEMVTQQRNPCERLVNYFCAQDKASLNCTAYQPVLDESENDSSAEMRGSIRAQCETKITRLLDEDKVAVP